MKTEQQPLGFQPITITLETAAEARAFCAIVDSYEADEYDETVALANRLSDLFTLGELDIPSKEADA